MWRSTGNVHSIPFHDHIDQKPVMRLPQIEYAFVDERKVRANNDIKSVMETQFGSKYVIEGPLAAPDGQFAQIRAIWFVEHGASAPRFVTAYPLRGKRSP